MNENEYENHLFTKIPEYDEIISDLSRGNLKADFSLCNRKSKLSYSLDDILFDEKNDELSYFVLFMDSINSSNYLKFLLDLNNFESAFRKANANASSTTCISCRTVNNTYESFASSSNCGCQLNKNVSNDALSIYTKYISKDAKYPINFPDDLHNQIISNICPENKDSLIDLKCFESGKQFVYDLVHKQFYSIYLFSDYHCKYLMNILENQQINLADLLYDDIAVVYLLEYLEQEKCSDLLKFWIQAENFSRNIASFEKSSDLNSNIETIFKQWQSDAVIIYDNFISLQAKSALGFDLLVRRQVETNICQYIDNQTEDIDYLINTYSNVFYLPMLIVFSILEKVFFKKFLSSSLYQKYINEIKINSQIASSNQKKTNKKQTKPKSPLREANLNNDLLYSRPNSSNMQFGKIDSTGRFINDAWSLDESDSIDFLKRYKDQGGFKFKLDSLFGKMSHKHSSEELEMAEQMAAMLVRDVVNQNQLS